MSSNGSYRIGVNTGGTFTDVTALRVEDGALFTAKIPSTPSDPSQALISSIQAILEISGADPSAVTSLVHGTTVAANALVGRPNQNMALVVNEGFQHVLEIARQSAPEGFGSSYFWVKPARLLPVERVYELGGRMGCRGKEISPIDEESARDLAYQLKKMDVESVAICLLHSYANPAHERLLRKYFSEEHPECHVSLSSDVLPEYQEYERAVATIMDAACKPAIRGYFNRAIENLSKVFPEAPPFRIMKSSGGVTGVVQAVDHPLSTAMSGPAAGVLACEHLAAVSGINKAITLDGGGTSSEVSIIENAHLLIASSSKLGNHEINLPMIDIATVGVGGGSIAWVSDDNKLRVGPRSAGADPGPMCYGSGGEEPTVTDAQLFLGLLPDRLAGGGLPLDHGLAAAGIKRIAEALGIPPHRAARGIVSMAAWEQVQAIREKTVHQGKDPREYALIAFGGMGPLMASEIAGILGITEIVVPARAGNNSSIGLAEASPRYDYAKTHLSTLNDASIEEVQSQFDLMMIDAAADLDADNIPTEKRSFSRFLDLRYSGESQEIGVEVSHLDSSTLDLDAVLKAFHASFREQFGNHHIESDQVELVNLHLAAMGFADGAAIRSVEAGVGADSARIGERQAGLSEEGPALLPVFDCSKLGKGDSIEGPAIIEEAGSTILIPRRGKCETDEWGNIRIHLGVQPNSSSGGVGEDSNEEGPIVYEIIKGALISIEREMEGRVEKGARSSLMRDARDFRAALFDSKGRKLTGRSFSATIGPVLNTWTLNEFHDGDVIIWNDPYLSRGGAAHQLGLCVCFPIFFKEKLTAFALLFGCHDDIGGALPGTLLSNATNIFQEGILVPPIKLWEGGVFNEAALQIISRNSREADDLRADIHCEVAACHAGGARVAELCGRFGADAVAGAFEALITRGEKAVREELLSKIPDGEYEFEDYIESDGVNKNKAYALKVRMTKADGKIELDFTEISPQAAGPINWPVGCANGRHLKSWLAPLLRNLAGSYERMFEIDINEGVDSLMDIVFPGPGSLLTPIFPAPTSMSSLTASRVLSLFCGVLGIATKGRFPADQETSRYWGLRGNTNGTEPFLFREILGGGTGGRAWADGEDAVHTIPGCRNFSAELIESRFPVQVERVALSPDSGGAGKRRGGLGYLKEFRVLCDCSVFSYGARSLLPPWGVNGGRAGGLFRIIVNPGTPAERKVPGLSDGVNVIEGDLIRVVTTGGGGWGNPFERELQYVRRDALWGKVTFDGAMRQYGVVFSEEKNFKVDVDGSMALRQMMGQRRKKTSFIDRGPNFAALKSRGVL